MGEKIANDPSEMPEQTNSEEVTEDGWLAPG